MLLEATESRECPLVWRDWGRNKTTEVNGVRVELFRRKSLLSERLYLALSEHGSVTVIEQPRPRPLLHWRGRRRDQVLYHLFEGLERSVRTSRVTVGCRLHVVRAS
jgi:hypothetical protein